ncbi:hypothetical protein [Listeria rustica]|uniref:Uncharacterized protein n=1 Tax=Listeria rustica TaxID=2713503 RepID=A0A7W1T5D7_9LIST|nr:hypothetical protein [Listeria rustica]MBA3925722.1 hypothetical protein [Listeria rustica]
MFVQDVMQSLPEHVNRGFTLDHFPADFDKAQTLQTLAEVLSIQTENTYKSMIDTDKMLAMQVVNAILNEPGTNADFKLACEQDPNAVIDQVKTYMKENK